MVSPVSVPPEAVQEKDSASPSGSSESVPSRVTVRPVITLSAGPASATGGRLGSVPPTVPNASISARPTFSVRPETESMRSVRLVTGRGPGRTIVVALPSLLSVPTATGSPCENTRVAELT